MGSSSFVSFSERLSALFSHLLAGARCIFVPSKQIPGARLQWEGRKKNDHPKNFSGDDAATFPGCETPVIVPTGLEI
ncbi:hypothetical protein F5Y07DRAFT_353358 [Xylaria sp. FL0933]|nr:hypothetical protein F5Y07DRAFT_353358 [Xylaria sp. FL0933]